MPAQALVARTFVSAAGSDSNNCANVATPCRHLATAYAATAPNGEIFVLDPANYGALTITGPVSIEGHGWASIAPVTDQAAITVNANPGDKINIIGVVLDGTALTGTTGILFTSGGTLNLRDSVIRNVGDYGIDFQPNSSGLSQLFVSNTLVSDNGLGIVISPSGSGTTTAVLDHVLIENSGNGGLQIENPAPQTINVTISDSVSANNQNGIFADSTGGMPATIVARNSTFANNTVNGLQALDSATILVTRSTITGNAAAWSGNVSSYTDNNIDGNTSGNTAPPSALVYK